MTQLGLFDAPLSLIEGERGSVTYRSGFLLASQADAYFSALRDGVDWHAHNLHAINHRLSYKFLPRQDFSSWAIVDCHMHGAHKGVDQGDGDQAMRSMSALLRHDRPDETAAPRECGSRLTPTPPEFFAARACCTHRQYERWDTHCPFPKEVHRCSGRPGPRRGDPGQNAIGARLRRQ